MSFHCDVARGSRCRGETGCICFRCGGYACQECSVRMRYLGFGVRRVCLSCLDEMARFGELDYLTLSPVDVQVGG